MSETTRKSDIKLHEEPRRKHTFQKRGILRTRIVLWFAATFLVYDSSRGNGQERQWI